MYFTYEVQAATCGDGSNCVFVTSSRHEGNLGGLAGADAICQDRAEAGGSRAAPGVYLAWLSDATASPSTRFTQASVPYRLVDGTAIADDWADLVDGSLDAPIQVLESGSLAPPVHAVWTGTETDGTRDADDCAGWTTGSTGTFGLVGDHLGTTRRWTSGGLGGCGFTLALYCFQQ
jgi:hypothetical protein